MMLDLSFLQHHMAYAPSLCRVGLFACVVLQPRSPETGHDALCGEGPLEMEGRVGNRPQKKGGWLA